MFWKTEPTVGPDGIAGTAVDGTQTVATGYLQDVMSVVNDVIGIMTSEPIIYFVMLGLIAASVGTVRKLIPSKRK